MKFKRITRQVRPLATFSELIADKHPELYRAFNYHTGPVITLAASDYLMVEEEQIRRLMEEKPRPGRGER